MKFILDTCQVDHYLTDQWKEIAEDKTEQEITDQLQSPLFYVEEDMFARISSTKPEEWNYIYRNGEWRSLSFPMKIYEYVWTENRLFPTYENWLKAWKRSKKVDDMLRALYSIIEKEKIVHGMVDCLRYLRQHRNSDEDDVLFLKKVQRDWTEASMRMTTQSLAEELLSDSPSLFNCSDYINILVNNNNNPLGISESLANVLRMSIPVRLIVRRMIP